MAWLTQPEGRLGVGAVVLLVFGTATLIPSVAVAVRRLHDTARSGWRLLICLVPVVGTGIALSWLLGPTATHEVTAGGVPWSWSRQPDDVPIQTRPGDLITPKSKAALAESLADP